MKTIEVVAAILLYGDKVFATQRGYGEFEDGWEFPGGKVEPGEASQEALIREIKEELNVEISVGQRIDTVEYDYPKFHLSMECFICSVKSGELVLKEHKSSKWLTAETLNSVEWLPADLGLIPKIRERLLCAGAHKEIYGLACDTSSAVEEQSDSESGLEVSMQQMSKSRGECRRTIG